MLNRLALVTAAVVLAAGLLVARPPAARAAGCAPWPTTFDPPPTIRVLRTATGVVDEVPFRAYVENVLYWEWPSWYPTEALKAGAVAVKQYAWYKVRYPRSTAVTPSGACYHVRDDTWDQIYDPSRTPTAAHLAAVDATWLVTLRRSGSFFLSGYGPGTADMCGADLSSTRTRLAQRGVRACALAGKTMAEILRVYLDPGLSIATARRIHGQDRFATGTAISSSTFAPGVPVAFVATGLDFPDALAAGPAAALLGGPVLLVWPDSVPAAVATELARLQPARIVVLGSVGAVSDGVLEALKAFAPEVVRVAGATRYETAAATSATAFAPGVPVAFIATGQNFPDALVGAAAGARLGGPVLLVPPDSIPAEVAAELTRLAPAAIHVLGAPSVVSDAVLAGLGQYAPTVTRLAGGDRYATAAAASAALFTPNGGPLYLATGTNFPDALSAGPLGGPLLLLSPWSTPGAEVAAEAVRLQPSLLVPIGGAPALSDASVAGLAAALPQ